MRVEDLKRWHWIVIAIIVGLTYSYLRVSMEPPANPRSTRHPQFEAWLREPPLKTGELKVKDIQILPPVEGKYLVNFQALQPTKDNKAWQYNKYCFYAETPFKPTQDRPAQPNPDETIITYLKSIQGKYPGAKFTYAWWREPKWTYTIFTLGSVLLIGGVWPSLIGLLVGAGFGRPKKAEAEPEYDLSRFGKQKAIAAIPVAKRMNDEDEEKLRALEEELERNLSAARSERPATPIAAAQPQIRKLSSAPLEAAPVQQAKPQDEKQYAGEFYPTIAHAPAKKKE
jgi:hypothetical protein